jgi:hypothetical protein
MHTRAAVDVRRIFVGEEEDLHVGFYVVVAALVSSAEWDEQTFAATNAYFARTSSTGTSTACRTLSTVAP